MHMLTMCTCDLWHMTFHHDIIARLSDSVLFIILHVTRALFAESIHMTR